MNITNKDKEKKPINIIESENKSIKTTEKEKTNKNILYNKSKKYRHYYKL